MFGMPGGAELIIIAIVMLVLGVPALLVGFVVWLVSRNRPTAPTPLAPAAWLADPTGRHELRYWNGSTWTVHVADAGVQSEDPL